jgi:hypothetical protein
MIFEGRINICRHFSSVGTFIGNGSDMDGHKL